jgi:CheY-like chemotaxis protein
MSALAGCRILVVEDEYLLSRQLTRALEREGARVACVPTVPAALASLAEAPAPDVAILDVNLAGAKVYPVAEELAQRNVPFVFCSGYDAEDRDPRFADAAHLTKPIAMPVLLRCLTGLIGSEARPVLHVDT